jgi:cell wall-associated NlpC family hydrolase
VIRFSSGLAKPAAIGLAAVVLLLIVAVMAAPMLLFAAGGLLYSTSNACSSAGSGGGNQPPPSSTAQNSIPANYLYWFKKVGTQYKVPWVILAGIAKVESDDGQTTLPGVHSGANPYGAAGPMQIGIGGAAGNTWGGAPIHPASEQVNGVATDETGDGVADVYTPADAIAGAAKYLLENGVLDNVQNAIFAYNHLESYVQSVLGWASLYAKGGYSVSPVTVDDAPTCIPGTGVADSTAAAAAISFAEAQLGKPYQWGGVGPDSYDCSGLVMMAYRSAGVYIPRTSQEQWIWGPRVPASDVEPGDLVFFVGADGTETAPGHVGIVIGAGLMIEAPAPGLVIRVAPYTDRDPIGFTAPWAHPGAGQSATADSQVTVPASSPASTPPATRPTRKKRRK